MTEIATILAKVMEVVLLVVNEIFLEKKLARERAERLAIDYEKMAGILVKVTASLRNKARIESEQARRVEDAIEAAKKAAIDAAKRPR